MNLTRFFYYVVSLSLMGSVLAVGLIPVKRFIGQRLSANWHYCIWFVLVLRLMIPYTPSVPFNIYNFIPHTGHAIVLPPISMPVSEADSATTASTDDTTAIMTPGNALQSKNVQMPQAAPEKAWLTWQNSALVWLIGVATTVSYILFINALFLRRNKKLRKCESQDVLQILKDCKAKLNIRSEVSVVYDAKIKSPAIFGVLRPKIIISPEIVKKLSHEELSYIFLHELSHFKRGDLLVNGLVLALQTIHWFNPLIWYALRQMKQDCEMACDAYALAALKPEDHKKYGQTIISLLQLLSEPQWAPGTLGFVSKFNTRRIIMITRFKRTTFKWAITALALTLLIGCSSLNNPLSATATGQNPKDALSTGQQNTDIINPADSNPLLYKNTQFGFNFKLPESWKGYTIVRSQWEGLAIGEATGEKVVETGALLSIRHPQWTSQNPRQDIPIMVFTRSQWESLQQGVFHIGAAPIGPSELGRNDSYIFALPARYNFAFPTGYEEVETILANQPLQATQPTQSAPDPIASLLSKMMELGKQGKVINSDIAAKTNAIQDVEKIWGKADKIDWVAAAKGRYATYASHHVVFGINKGEQIFEVRSFDSQLKSITLAKAKEILGVPAHDAKSAGQEIIGYIAGAEFKVELVFPQPTKDNPNPVLDHYNVLYPQGTVNSMADDPGRQW